MELSSYRSTPRKDLVGVRFGKLVVLEQVNNTRATKNEPWGVVVWKCNCDCGNTTLVRQANLKHKQRSCSTACAKRLYTGCSVDGCQGPHEARGYCRAHYRQADYWAKPEVRDRARRYNLVERYGLSSEEERDAMLRAQGGVCAICSTDTPGGRYNEWHMDHDHSCCAARGKTCGKCNRGLLCSSCNIGLGFVDKVGLPSVVTYLTKNR